MATPTTSDRRAATPDEIRKVKEYQGIAQDDDIQVDDDAQVSECDEGIWVQAWVWLPNEAR